MDGINCIFGFFLYLVASLWAIKVAHAFSGCGKNLIWLAIFVKLAFAFMMYHILMEFYNGGDLPTYYLLALKLSKFEVDLYQHLYLDHLVAVLNAFVMMCFGKNIYTLIYLSALSSLAYFLFSFSALKQTLMPKQRSLMALLLFLPSLGLFSTFTGGKEVYILPCLGYLTYMLSLQRVHWFRLILIIMFIGLIRPYQAAICAFCIMMCLFSISNTKEKIRLIFFGIPLVFACIVFLFQGLIGSMDMIIQIGLSKFINQTYHGGNFILQPYPMPFTFLQMFRPFVFEANGLFSFCQSIESTIVLIVFLRLINCVFLHRKNYFKENASKSEFRLYRFLLYYIITNLILFSLSANVGDLARRHIYVYPQIIVLFALLQSVLFRVGTGRNDSHNRLLKEVI